MKKKVLYKMFRRKSILFLTFVFILFNMTAFISEIHADETTVTFQQGLDGYNAVRDTYIDSWSRVAHSADNNLAVGFNGSSIAFIKYDLSSIPNNSMIKKATLSLYLLSSDAEVGSQNQGRKVNAHNMLCSWTDSEVSWRNPWSKAGCEAGVDFEKSYGGSGSSGNKNSWVDIDITQMVQNIVYNPSQNKGFALFDPDAYNAPPGSNGTRTYASSENTNASIRPKLIIEYEPHAPRADAGADIIDLNWDNGSKNLDASSSFGMQDEQLIYSWKVVKAPFASQLKESIIGSDMIQAFAPDTPGDYTIELTVINSKNISSKDYVNVKVLKIKAAHPRIILDGSMLATLRAKAASNDDGWVRFKDSVDNMRYNTAMDLYWKTDPGIQFALLYQIYKDSDASAAKKYADMAIRRATDIFENRENIAGGIGRYMYAAIYSNEISIIYDWLYGYEGLTNEISGKMYEFVKQRMNYHAEDPTYKYAWQNENLRIMRGLGISGIAFAGETIDADGYATYWMDKARNERFGEYFLPGLELACEGGGWAEGEQYGNSLELAMEYMMAQQTATGERLFTSSKFFQDLIKHYIHANSNDWIADYGVNGNAYRMLHRRGEMDTRYSVFHDRTRYAMLLILNGLQGLVPDSELKLGWDWVQQPPTGANTKDRMRAGDLYLFRDFLLDNPQKGDLNVNDFGSLDHFEKGIGMVYARSSWEPDATWITFQAGDHFSTHQQRDQGHFTIYKSGYLAADGGSYDWFKSPHTAHYANNSIAHNTIAVLDPNEVSDPVFSDIPAEANYEGQRGFVNAAGPEVQTVEQFNMYKSVYDTADIKKYVTADNWTYAQGDITNAYKDKIQKFVREFLFIRPGWVITFDRVNTREESLVPRWLMQSVNEPTVNGNIITTVNGNHLADQFPISGQPDGKLYVKNLLPANQKIELIGGSGHEAWVGGKNFPADADGSRLNKCDWRVEISPTASSKENIFLNVMYATDVNSASMPVAERIDAGNMQGVYMNDGNSSYAVLFCVGDINNGNAEYAIPIDSTTNNILYNLNGNQKYRVEAENTDLQRVKVIADSNGEYQANADGVLTFATSGSELSIYSVSFDSKGGNNISSIQAVYNSKINIPTEPIREGYTFEGWYKEDSYTSIWDFANDKITKDITLYAKWAKNISNNADLRNITLNSGSLIPDFNKGVYSYTVNLANDTNSIIITPISDDTKATIKINEKAVMRGQASDNMILSYGHNIINIVVTAEDLTTKRTYTIDVNRSSPPPPPPPPPLNDETRVVPGEIGDEGKTGVNIEIVRTTTSDGIKKDTVEFDEKKASETVQKVLEISEKKAVICIPDIKNNEASEVDVAIKKDAAEQLGQNGISLGINSDKVKIEFPEETLESMGEKDVHIKIKEVNEEQKQKTNQVMIRLAADSKIIAKPIAIETDFPCRTKITLPLKDVKLPANAKELEEFLSSLAVLVEHSDGENKIDKGTIEYDKDGNPVGISIWIEKYSIFTIVGLPDALANFEGKAYTIEYKVMPDKVWTIKFNADIKSETVNEKTIYVLNSNGIIHSVNCAVDGSIIIVSPNANYENDKVYYLYILKDITSKSGKALKASLRYQFEINK